MLLLVTALPSVTSCMNAVVAERAAAAVEEEVEVVVVVKSKGW